MQDMRFRKQTNLTLDPALLADLDAWIEEQPYKLRRSNVVETAIQEFLDRQRMPPRRGERK